MIQMGPPVQYQVNSQNQPRRIEPAVIQPSGTQYSNVMPTQSSIRQGPPLSGVTPMPSTSTAYGTTLPGTVNSSRLAQNPFFNRQQPQSTPSSYVNPSTTAYTQPTGSLQPPK
jgi:hypothetical protein